MLITGEEMKQITLKEFWEKSIERLLQGDKGRMDYVIDLDGDTTYTGMIIARGSEKLLWANNGSICIPVNTCTNYNKLVHMCKDVTENKASYCIRCGKKITGKVQHWFAGRYCDKCWTPADEQSRNWDYSHLD